MKSLPFILISFLLSGMAYAQRNTQATSSAIATATIISNVAGVEKKGDINFTNIDKGTAPGTIQVNSINSSTFKIIDKSYSYSISISSTNITAKKNGSEETIEIDSLKMNSIEDRNDLTANLNLNSQSMGLYTSTTPLNVIINYN